MSHPESTPVTVLRAGIEDIEPNHWVVSIFDLLGCFSSGCTEQEAVGQAPDCARAYFAWLGSKDGNPAPFDDPVEVAIIERIALHPSAADPGRMVHGFFEEDRRPLRLWDVDMILRLLEWNRQDLLERIASIPHGGIETPVNDPTWKTVKGLLEHIYGAEQWLLHNLGLDLDRADMPRGTMERMDAVRRRLLQVVPDLAESEEVREVDGELWSPRKMVRRALWHERDHAQQLEKLLALKM
jgi:predicted RNase H-like HicB family nuclease